MSAERSRRAVVTTAGEKSSAFFEAEGQLNEAQIFNARRCCKTFSNFSCGRRSRKHVYAWRKLKRKQFQSLPSEFGRYNPAQYLIAQRYLLLKPELRNKRTKSGFLTL
jgi:hypothetical protein